MEALDHRIVAWLSGLDLPLVTPLMKLASAFGASGLVFVGIGFWVALARRRIAPAVVVLAAVFASQLLSNLMKHAVGRDRPSLTYADVHPLIAVPGSSSMPSGHAWIAFAAATVLWVVIPARRAWIVGLAALIALSRVYLGVHYPSDVLVGAAGGVATGLLVLLGARLVHVEIRPDDDGDARNQRQVDAPGGADGDAGRQRPTEVARLRDDPVEHKENCQNATGACDHGRGPRQVYVLREQFDCPHGQRNQGQ
jgi:undecaprenyl-diphosphatase